jgi:hypothetical protein
MNAVKKEARRRVTIGGAQTELQEHPTTAHSGVKRGISTGLVTGQRLKRCARPERLAYWPENKSLMAELFRRHWLELLPSDMVDGWVVPGSRGQAWEYGPGKLGFTVIGAKAVGGAVRKLGDIARITQHGDDEANFVVDWTPENLRRIGRQLRLYRRRGAPQVCQSQAAPSQNPNLVHRHSSLGG